MGQRSQSRCPGCGLQRPVSDTAVYGGYYHTTPACWEVYTEVLGAEFGNTVLYGQIHQLTVDSYAVQHAGGRHPDKSVAIHLAGLHLMLDRGLRPTAVPPLLQRLASAVHIWPHFPPPARRGAVTVGDVALADSIEQHIDAVRAWAGAVWAAWSNHHTAMRDFVARNRIV